MNNEPIIVEQIINASPEKIWKAITDKEEMKKWYFELAGFKPEVGFEFQFTGGTEERTYLHLCRITEVIENKKLTHSWKYDGYEGNSFVTFELFAEGTNTKIRLTHEGVETFPASNPDFAKKNFVEGWTAIIGTSQVKYIQDLQASK